MDIQSRINHEQLTSLVRLATKDNSAVLGSWQMSPIQGGTGSAIGGTALYRLKGKTSQEIPWSLVLKILFERADEPITSPYYWKREYEIYHSKFLDDLPIGGMRTPEIYLCQAFPDASWIWMEDIVEDTTEWQLNDFNLVGKRLGEFNGIYLMGHPIPQQEWLSDHWHCQIVPALSDTFDKLDEFLEHPLAQRVLPLSDKKEILDIWEQRALFSNALLTLPQTFCHFDAFRNNFFHHEQTTTIIDWALAGRGAIGEELVCFVAVSLYYSEDLFSQANALEQVIFSGYMDGLRAVGWQGDERLARLGYSCGMVLRGLAGVKQDILLVIDESQHPRLLTENQKSTIEEVADFFAAIRQFRLIKMANEARTLLNQLS